MKAMILAAGRGSRMGALTRDLPKPLLTVGGQPLIVWQLRRLAKAGIKEVVINVAYLGEKIIAALGDGQRYGVRIVYSEEGARGLETAGGIINALPLLGEEPFLVVNADVWCALDYQVLIAHYPNTLAHLVLVETPEWKETGDFDLNEGRVSLGARYTFAGISIMQAALFSGLSAQFLPLAPLLRQTIAKTTISGVYFAGDWLDVGTPERLAAAQKRFDDHVVMLT